MGQKGAKHTQATAEAAEALAADLAPLGHVTTKKMFGGYGVFSGGVMFALVDSEGNTYLRVGEANEARFAGAERHGRMPYAAIPDDVSSDSPTLVQCAEESLAVARAAKKR